jgi:cell division protein FtsL
MAIARTARQPVTVESLVRSSRPRTMALADLHERRLLVRLGLVAVVLACVLAIANVAIRLRVFDLAYRIEVTRQALLQAELESRELQAQTARLEDPARLEELAQRFGLRRPSASEKVVLP